jgi:predicted nucleic acid-binding protein
MIVCDTGPLVAAALSNDDDHHASVELLTGLHLANRAVVVPAPVVADVGYLLGREAGGRVESMFLRSMANGDLVPAELAPADYLRMADLVEQYADLPLGTTDAAVITIAERLDITEIATLDRRHFTVVRPRHTTALTLLP